VLAVAAKPEFYRVDVEVPHHKPDGTTEYTYTPQKSDVSEELAKEMGDGLKAMGIGGRIVHLDGTPDGKVIVIWGNVEREAEAEKIEKAALEKK
jgi:hypothetical protein